MDRQTKLIWAAGFIDGEGCITITPDRNNFQCVLTVAQVNKRPLEILHELFNGALRFVPSLRGGHWEWRVYADTASKACEELIPFLINKQEQAQILVLFQSTKGIRGKILSSETYELRFQLYTRIVKLNPRRALDAERLSEEAPQYFGDDAIVRSHTN